MWLVSSLEVLLRWYYEEACSSVLLIGVVIWEDQKMTLDVRSLACGDRDMCENGGELIRHNYTLGKLAIPNKAICRDLSTTCAHNLYSRNLSSLEENLKIASIGRNM